MKYKYGDVGEAGDADNDYGYDRDVGFVLAIFDNEGIKAYILYSSIYTINIYYMVMGVLP